MLPAPTVEYNRSDQKNMSTMDASENGEKFRNVIVWLLYAVIVTLVLFAPYIFTKPAYSQMEAECVSSCRSRDLPPGKLVKRDGPDSPKPSAQKFDCVCNR